MTFLPDQILVANESRTYHIEVPDNPLQELVPVIIVFHGGGQDARNVAARWGVVPGNPVPTYLQNYLLVFPESHPQLNEEWVHFKAGDRGFPTLDLDFVQRLLIELTTRSYGTGSATFPYVKADPTLAYAAGFSNGGGMAWQLLNSDLASSFRGFAAVGKALDPEKAQHYRKHLGPGVDAAPAPVVYVQGTADRGFRPPFTQEETPLEETLPFFTVREMLTRNNPGVPLPSLDPANTSLAPGSAWVTEVVTQLFLGDEAFLQVTVINGGHNWPTPTSSSNPPVADHFDATIAIVGFWRSHAGLP
jgi:poly(3-hydroxybutyrate) depolymerase